MTFSEKVEFLRAGSSTKIQVRQRLLVVARHSRDSLTFFAARMGRDAGEEPSVMQADQASGRGPRMHGA